MSRQLTLGSLFDGSGGFPLGGLLSGIKPVWASEIEPFPIRVTTKRMPYIKHYGDIGKMNGADIEPVDIVTCGSPCQDMSVAGKRAGLDGSRSNLFYEAIRIVKEMRCKTDGRYPRYIVWENVPGAFSSNKGEDFRCVLESICKIKDETVSVPECRKWLNAGEIVGNGYSLAWRVLDAQYWGVPQRRKRIYLVADFADECAGKILFESEGLSGYSAESFRAWQRASCDFENCSGATGYDGYNGQLTDNVSSTLGANCGMSTGRNGVILNDQGGSVMTVTENVTATLRANMGGHPPIVMDDTIAVENHPSDSRVSLSETGTVQTLSTQMGTGGNNVPLLLKIRSGCEGGGKGALIQKNKSATLSCNNDQTLFEPKTYGICSKNSNSMKSDNPNSGIYEAETSRTIDANGGNPSCNQGGMAVVCVDQGGGKSNCTVSDGLSPTLACTHGGEPVIAIEGNGQRPSHHGNGYSEDDVSYTLNATEQHGVAYGLDRAAFNQGQNALYNFAVEKEVEPTIVAKGSGAVAHPTYSTSKASFFTNASEEKANTLVSTDWKGPPIINDKSFGFYPQMKAEGITMTEEKSATLVNGTNPGYQNGVIAQDYIVRRLTPTECARLQGFPDWWCANLGTQHPTDTEVYEWYKIFEEYRKTTGSSSKPKTDKQIRKFLKEPHSDSAEYKMWGNGVALPCVVFVLSGIVYCDEMNG